MDSSQTIIWMIIICVFFIFAISFAKPIRSIVSIFIQGMAGIVCMSVTNFFLSYIGVSVGINFLTFFTVGFLGIPGFVTLYILQAIL